MQKTKEDEEFEAGVADALKSGHIRRKLHDLNPFSDLNSSYEKGYHEISDRYSNLFYFLSRKDKRVERKEERKGLVGDLIIVGVGIIIGAYILLNSGKKLSNDDLKPASDELRLERIVNETTPTNDYMTSQKYLNTHY